jgi:hypothetical protein
MADSQPFRFLGLPKDIRFMVYDLLPLIICHHVVKVCGRGGHPERSVNIVSKRIPGISLIYTCRETYAEALPLQRKIEEAKALRIITDWRSVGGAAMKAMLLCASPNKCGDSPELAILLHPVGSCFSDRLKHPSMCNEAHIFYRDYDTHDELHALLNHGTPLKSRLRIEIAVKCGEDLFGLEGQLEQYCREFYKWVASMRPPGLEWQVMDIVLRPVPVWKTCSKCRGAILSRIMYSWKLSGRPQRGSAVLVSRLGWWSGRRVGKKAASSTETKA